MTNDEDRVWEPHTFTPWRGKDYERCNTCGECVEEHNKMYDPTVLCSKPIAGAKDTVCDRPVVHGEEDWQDSSDRVCSGVRGNAA